MKVLITGGTGALGRLVAREAARVGHGVRIMSRGERASSVPDGFEWARADIATVVGVPEALAGVDAVIHSASDPRRAAAVDVEGTRRLVEAVCAAAPAAHLVYISIVGVDVIPFGYYRRKREAEEMIEASGVAHSILRATQFHTFVDALVSAAARVPLLMPLPTDFRFQSVDDAEVARRLVRQLDARPAGRLADFGGPEVLTLGEMVEAWRDAKGVRKRAVRLPLPGAVAAAFRAGKNTAPGGERGVTPWREWLARPEAHRAASLSLNQV